VGVTTELIANIDVVERLIDKEADRFEVKEE